VNGELSVMEGRMVSWRKTREVEETREAERARLETREVETRGAGPLV